MDMFAGSQTPGRASPPENLPYRTCTPDDDELLSADVGPALPRQGGCRIRGSSSVVHYIATGGQRGSSMSHFATAHTRGHGA